MYGHDKTWTAIVVFVPFLLNGFARIATAGRSVPAPLISQFDQGYGVVAAEAIEATLVPEQQAYTTTYATTFKVHEIVAQPVRGKAFSLQAGETLKINLTAGYACQIEIGDPKAELAHGRRYYLIVRQCDNGEFEHAPGASGLWPVQEFTAAENKYYAQVRGLAAVPKENRLRACVDVANNSSESERIRSEALSGVRGLWRNDRSAGESYAQTALRKLWNDLESHLSLILLGQFDDALCMIDQSFEDSADRRDVLLDYLLAPTPDRKKNDPYFDLDNTALFVFADLARRHPDVTGRRLAAQLLDTKRLPLFRRSIACGLLDAYQRTEQVDPIWEKDLRKYFVCLMNDGEPFAIRVAAGDLEYFVGVKSAGESGTRRWYIPDADVRTALNKGVERLTAASKKPDADLEFGTAARELKRVIHSLDGSPKPLNPQSP